MARGRLSMSPIDQNICDEIVPLYLLYHLPNFAFILTVINVTIHCFYHKSKRANKVHVYNPESHNIKA